MSNDLDTIMKFFGEKPDEEQEAAKEIMKATDGLAKWLINPARTVDEVLSDQDADHALRPHDLSEVVGQDKIKLPLTIAMRAAKRREAPLGHTLLLGPPGLGKTTIASIIAREMGTLLIMDTGPQLSAQKLTYYCGEIIKAKNDEEMDVTFFVDEAQKIPSDAITVLLPLLEDFRFLNSLHTPQFTFVAATTDPGSLPNAFLERFGYQYQVTYYSTEEIAMITARNVAKVWGIEPHRMKDDPDEAEQIAHNEAVGIRNEFLARPAVQESILTIADRSRGIPRTANRLIRHVHDYAIGMSEDEPKEGELPDLTPEVVLTAMKAHGVDKMGLTHIDRALIVAMATRYAMRPVGIDAISSAIGENVNTVKAVMEPFLVRSGLINRTLRGRELTDAGKLVATKTLLDQVEY